VQVPGETNKSWSSILSQVINDKKRYGALECDHIIGFLSLCVYRGIKSLFI